MSTLTQTFHPRTQAMLTTLLLNGTAALSSVMLHRRTPICLHESCDHFLGSGCRTPCQNRKGDFMRDTTVTMGMRFQGLLKFATVARGAEAELRRQEGHKVPLLHTLPAAQTLVQEQRLQMLDLHA